MLLLPIPLLAFTLAATTEARADGRAPRPPNIVHIVADDVAYDDLGCYGAQDIATPNIDRLAREGLRLTSFYAPSSTCTPTRASLLTGCYAQRVGLATVLFPDSKEGLAAEEVTIAELVRQRGYATALIGKWHLGCAPQFLPTRHGFDLFFGIPYPNDHGPERLTFQEPRVTRGFPPIPVYRGEVVVEQPAQLAALPERFVAEAVRFIDEHREKPFYLHFSNIETHTPWLVAQPFQYRSKAGVYGDAVQCLDWAVGELVKAIDERGLGADTLIVVTSDNGPLVHRYPELEGIYGHAATVDTSRPHALREGKYQSRFEGGTRVPCVARWTGRIPAGATSDALVAGFDLYPTFAALAGASVPDDRIVDGRDIGGLLLGTPGAAVPHEEFYFYESRRLVAVRGGTWKLVFPAEAGEGPKLFDLRADLAEAHDVAAEHPAAVERLQALAERARADLGDAATGRQGANVRPPGRVE